MKLNPTMAGFGNSFEGLTLVSREWSLGTPMMQMEKFLLVKAVKGAKVGVSLQLRKELRHLMQMMICQPHHLCLHRDAQLQ